jgi:superoxide dismutase, Cu-Zn family
MLLAFLGAAFAQVSGPDVFAPRDVAQITPPTTFSMPADIVPPRTLTVPVSGPGGKALGTATLTEASKGVVIRIELNPSALLAGWHGVHLYEKGDCSGATFAAVRAGIGASAGRHGLLNRLGPQAGDLPNLYAPVSGRIKADLLSPMTSLSARPPAGRVSLLDANGSALVIHAEEDDHPTARRRGCARGVRGDWGLNENATPAGADVALRVRLKAVP